MGGCATKPKDLKQDAPLPQHEEAPGDHKAQQQQEQSRGIDLPVDDRPPKPEEAVGEPKEQAVEAAAAPTLAKEEGEDEGKKKDVVDEGEAKVASAGSAASKEEWNLDDNKRRSTLGVLFMEDDGESVDGDASAETSGQKESDEQLSSVTAAENTPVIVERSVEVMLEEKEPKRAEGSHTEDEVAKSEDNVEAEGIVDQEKIVPTLPVPPVVEAAVESQEKAITTGEAAPTGEVPEEDPKPKESTNDVVENAGSTEGNNQDAIGAVDFIKETVEVAATLLPDNQGKQPEKQPTACAGTSSEVHEMKAVGEGDAVLEEQQQDTETADAVTATETSSVPVLSHPVGTTESVKEEEASQPLPPSPVEVVITAAAVVEVEKVSNNVSVDEQADPKLESAAQDSKATELEASGAKNAAGETVKAETVAASNAEKAAAEVDKAPAAPTTSDETAAPKLESAAEKSKTREIEVSSAQEATGEPDKAVLAVADTEKGSSAKDADAIVSLKQESGQEGNELPLSTPGSAAA